MHSGCPQAIRGFIPGETPLARKKPVSSRKRRTREHVMADLAVNHVERQALLSGFAIKRWFHDFGLDLAITTFVPETWFHNPPLAPVSGRGSSDKPQPEAGAN